MTDRIDLNRGLEGETPLADISGLKLKWVRTVSDLSKVEFTNVGKAIYKHTVRKPTNRTAPFTSLWMCRVHKDMYADVWTWAGIPRKTALNIGVTWEQVEVSLEQLAADLQAWQAGADFDLIAQAATMHHRAVQIHPFLNGNGRWARLLANIWLLKHGSEATRWPEAGMVKHASPIRGHYIAALKEADRGDLEPLISLHRTYGPRD